MRESEAFRVYTTQSKLKEIYEHPVGRDMLDLMCKQHGKGEKLLKSRFKEYINLDMLQRLPVFRKDKGFARVLVRLLNENDCLTENPARTDGGWWEGSVMYRVFLRSFLDGDADGVGDVKGLISALDYIKNMGADVILLGSALCSPGLNAGKDVSDHMHLQGDHDGTLADELIQSVHERGMKIVLEIPASCTSQEHEWFSGGDAERLYQYRKEPNNWTCAGGGSAFPHKSENGLWALRINSPSEPELNWDEPELRERMADVCRSWLEKGMDGICLSAASFISKHEGFPYGSESIAQITGRCGFEHYFFGPRLREYLARLKEDVFTPKNALLMGLTPGLGGNMSRLLTDSDASALDVAVSDIPLREGALARSKGLKYDLEEYKEYIMRMMREYDPFGITPLQFENDRVPRMLSRVDPRDKNRDIIAKMLAMLLLTLKGMPIIYQGEELGMADRHIEDASQLACIQSRMRYDELKDRVGQQKALQKVIEHAPEHAWEPIRWNASKNGGFCPEDVQPWTQVSRQKARNVESQTQDPQSVLNFYHTLLELRRNHPALRTGKIEFARKNIKGALVYTRTLGDETFLICCNLTDDWVDRRGEWPEGKLILSNCREPQPEGLTPYEADIWLCKNK